MRILTFLVLVYCVSLQVCALPTPDGGLPDADPGGVAADGDGEPQDTKPAPAENTLPASPAAGVGDNPVVPPIPAEVIPEECDTVCHINHQTTIIIFICILVCIILLIVILFGCYFMKKLHGKALLTTDYSEIIYRKPTKVIVKPGETMEKNVVTRTVEGDDPNVSRTITTTTTKKTVSSGGSKSELSEDPQL